MAGRMANPAGDQVPKVECKLGVDSISKDSAPYPWKGRRGRIDILGITSLKRN